MNGRMTGLMTALLCVMLLFSGCNSGGGVKKKILSLDESVEEYLAALRWGRYQDAWNYHAAQDGSKPAFPLEQLEQIRVTDHRVHEKDLNEDMSEASIKAQIEYYHTDYGTMRKAPLNQLWWYDPQARRWYLEGEMPQFR